jgi:hypothetical protein
MLFLEKLEAMFTLYRRSKPIELLNRLMCISICIFPAFESKRQHMPELMAFTTLLHDVLANSLPASELHGFVRRKRTDG